jgi:PAS domain S-box-containing protein
MILLAFTSVVIVALLVHRRRHARIERGVREHEARFRLMVDHAPVMIWTARADTTLDYLNRTCAEFTGLRLEQLLGKGWLEAVHPDDVEQCMATYGPAAAARRPFVMEFRLRRADGVYRWVLSHGVPHYGLDGSYAGYIGSTVDINERKSAEDSVRATHLELQRLAGRLIEGQDAERARVARDLHDDVSQQLAGLSIAFYGLRQRLPAQPGDDALDTELRGLQQRMNTLAESVRHLSHDLHPTVLQHVGLVAALTTYCAELQRSRGPVVNCTATGDFDSVAPATALCLYRIAQAALHNVIVHAEARRADVEIRRSGDRAAIIVTDDGKGFDVTRLEAGGAGLGLVSIRERARLAGGTVSIVTAPEKGTCVRAEVPAS